MKTWLSFFAFMPLFFASNAVHSQAAIATLSNQLSQGSASGGSGAGTLALSGSILRIDIYAGKLDGPSSGVYILCCDADIAKAAPATVNLLETNQAGMDHVSISIKPDTNDLSFWSSTFSGGNAANARSKLTKAFGEMTAYVVITTKPYSGMTGEISGQLAPPPEGSALTIRNAQGEAYGFIRITSTPGIMPLSPVANDYQCSPTSERCVIPVYVSSMPVNRTQICKARVDFSTVTVPQHQDYKKGKKIRVVWELVKGDVGDANEYRFMDSGIELSNSNDPSKSNDPTQDFNSKGRESADGKQYRWKRVGSKVGKKIDYLAWVERIDPATGEPTTCSPYDPTIANN